MVESLNAQSLQDELQRLAIEAGPEKAGLIQSYMGASRSRALALQCVPAEKAGPSDQYHGRLGGIPLLPADFQWPNDRKGVPMAAIAQFDLGLLPQTDVNCPNRGLLTIFRSQQILTMPAKDRRSFHISFLPEESLERLGQNGQDSSANAIKGSKNDGLPCWFATASPCWTVSEELDDAVDKLGLSQAQLNQLKAWAKKFNLLACGANRFLGADLQGVIKQKQICAFAASGISHSEARAQDHHYKHLIDDVPSWMLLVKLDDSGLFTTDHSLDPGTAKGKLSETRIFIRREDLASGLFERAWLICSSQES